MRKILFSLGLITTAILFIFSCSTTSTSITPNVIPSEPISKPLIEKDYSALLELTHNQIEDKAKKINGIATECMMDDFFLNSNQKISWEKVEGMSDGRHGIDGLYVKVVDGVVKDVMVAESKWNTSRLGSTKNKTVRQMSKQWILDKLEEVNISESEKPLYEQITRYVEKDIYRGILFNLKPSGDDLKVNLYTIKSKGDDNRFVKTEDRVIAINLKAPGEKFFQGLANSFDRCRVNAIKEKLPDLDDEDVMKLLSDGYIQGKDIEKVISKGKAL